MPSCSLLSSRPMLAKKTNVPQLTRVLPYRPQPARSPLIAARCLQTSVYTSRLPGCSSSSQPSSTFYIHSPPKQLGSTFSQSARHASSSSKWISRQSSDPFTREAKLQNLKSRAAFKLLQINERHRLFHPGMTVVDLGYAPGSWSQVAIDMVRPGLGRVIGVDVIPIQPPKGVNGIQGDFLSPEVQARVREFLRDDSRGRLRRNPVEDVENSIIQEETSYVDRERAATSESESSEADDADKCVDVVLSDMSAPWELNISSYKNSIINPYRRMMNTTGNKFRDHAGSMDLCRSALYFSYETLKVGGHFVCKFYQGVEDRKFEQQLKAMFHKVHREKPESSRSESREAFFVATKRLAKVDKNKVFDEG